MSTRIIITLFVVLKAMVLTSVHTLKSVLSTIPKAEIWLVLRSRLAHIKAQGFRFNITDKGS